MEVRACYAVVVDVAAYKDVGAVVGPFLLPLRVTFEALPSVVKLERFQPVFTLLMSLGGNEDCQDRTARGGGGEGNCCLPLGRPCVAVCLRVCGRLLLE